MNIVQEQAIAITSGGEDKQLSQGIHRHRMRLLSRDVLITRTDQSIDAMQMIVSILQIDQFTIDLVIFGVRPTEE